MATLTRNTALLLSLLSCLCLQTVRTMTLSTNQDLSQCGASLGMGSGEIPDEALSASSSYDASSVGPTRGRIRTETHGGAWCPKSQITPDSVEYLQIDLPSLTVITMVETQGRFGNGQGQEFAEQYFLEYQQDTEVTDFIRYRNRQGEELFQGNTNTYTAESRVLDPPIIARRIRFVPYSEQPSTVCMRVELYGCPRNDSDQSNKPAPTVTPSSNQGLSQCHASLGMQSGAIPDVALSASTSYASIVGPTSARIRTEKQGGAWCAQPPITPDAYEYLQVDLPSLTVIKKVETQGRFGNGQGQEFAKQYFLEYQQDTEITDFIRYRDRQGEEILQGNTNTYSAVSRDLDPPIVAIKVRFVPHAPDSSHPPMVCMRVELYGCPWSSSGLVLTLKTACGQ